MGYQGYLTPAPLTGGLAKRKYGAAFPTPTLTRDSSSFSPISLSPALWLDATTGLITNGAAQFTAANGEYLTRADNDTISAGDIDFWLAAWVYLDTASGNQYLITHTNASTLGGWALHRDNAAARYQFRIFNAGPAVGTVSATTFGAPGAGAWHFIMAYHDAVNNLVKISVNGGAFDSGATSAAAVDSTTALTLGALTGPVAATYHNGRMDSVCFGKSPVGGIAGLATAIRDSLYNAGAGKRYSDLSASEKTDWGLVSYWNLDETSGDRADAHGSNTLTDNNTVTYAGGIASGSATADSDPVSAWQDQSGNGRHVLQAVGTKRPTLKLAIQNGKSVVRFDGVDDWLALASALAPTDFTIFIVQKSTGDVRFFSGDGVGYQIRIGQAAANVLSMYDLTNNPISATLPVARTSWSTCTYQKNGSTPLFWGNGSSLATAGSFGVINLKMLGVGEAGGAPFLAGDIAEILVFDSAISASNRQAIEAYLNSRWGVY